MLEYQKELHVSKKNRVAMTCTTILAFVVFFSQCFALLLLKSINTSLEIYQQTASFFLEHIL